MHLLSLPFLIYRNVATKLILFRVGGGDIPPSSSEFGGSICSVLDQGSIQEFC